MSFLLPLFLPQCRWINRQIEERDVEGPKGPGSNISARVHMPRRPRIHLDGVPLHIVQHVHNRQSCFFGEEGYQAYLCWLDEALKKNSVR